VPEGVRGYLYAVGADEGVELADTVGTQVCAAPTASPTPSPTAAPTPAPSVAPTAIPTAVPAGAEPAGSSPEALWFGAALLALVGAITAFALRSSSTRS
jgi:hypothetical protein